MTRMKGEATSVQEGHAVERVTSVDVADHGMRSHPMTFSAFTKLAKESFRGAEGTEERVLESMPMNRA